MVTFFRRGVGWLRRRLSLPKYKIAFMLARRFGYTSYLEICTPSTGHTYSKVDRRQFSRRERLMYRRPPGYLDGDPLDYFTQAESAEELYGELLGRGERFDLVFIDSFHTYANSLVDIQYGSQLINPGGAVLIHDCNPPNAALTTPEFIPGAWFGMTFAAYLDVALLTEGMQHVTVDTDFGCGILGKDNRLAQLCNPRPDAALIAEWQRLDLSRKYAFLHEHRSQLLSLISPKEFRRRLAGDPSG